MIKSLWMESALFPTTINQWTSKWATFRTNVSSEKKEMQEIKQNGRKRWKKRKDLWVPLFLFCFSVTNNWLFSEFDPGNYKIDFEYDPKINKHGKVMIPHRDKPMDVPLGNRVYECQYGKDRNGSHKEKYHKRKAEEEEVSLVFVLSWTQNVHSHVSKFSSIFSQIKRVAGNLLMSVQYEHLRTNLLNRLWSGAAEHQWVATFCSN